MRDAERRWIVAAASVTVLGLLLVIPELILVAGRPLSLVACLAAVLGLLVLVWKLDSRDKLYYSIREQEAFLAGERQGKRQRPPLPKEDSVLKFPRPPEMVGPAGTYENSPLLPRG